MIEQAFCKASNSEVEEEDEAAQEEDAAAPKTKKDEANSLQALIKFLEKEVFTLSQQNDEHLSL